MQNQEFKPEKIQINLTLEQAEIVLRELYDGIRASEFRAAAVSSSSVERFYRSTNEKLVLIAKCFEAELLRGAK